LVAILLVQHLHLLLGLPASFCASSFFIFSFLARDFLTSSNMRNAALRSLLRLLLVEFPRVITTSTRYSFQSFSDSSLRSAWASACSAAAARSRASSGAAAHISHIGATACTACSLRRGVRFYS
jgi:hypothetical protein